MNSLTLRSKLALMFISVCIATFGVGGFLVASSAKAALEKEVHERLEFQARTYSTVLDSHLRMLSRRIEDFASDGFIRHQVDRIHQGGAQREEPLGELRSHLQQNKLPLEPAFLSLCVFDMDGARVLGTHRPGESGVGPLTFPPVSESYFSDLLGGATADEPPSMVLATPLYSLDRTEQLGTLTATVHPGIWIVDALRTADAGREAPKSRVQLHLIDRAHRYLFVRSDLSSSNGPAATSELVRSGYGLRLANDDGQLPHSYGNFTQDFPITSNGWSLGVVLPGDEIREAVAGLQSRFVGFGILISLVAAVLFLLPMSFVTRPLQKLQAAARRLASGELDARVEVNTPDEFGELAGSFNAMASAIEQRTHHLEDAAEALREQQAELSFERDRLRKVISSMHDGLVVLDGDGKVLIHNRAAGPLLEALSTRGIQLESRHTCTGSLESPDACRKCLFSPDLGSRSCVLELGGGVYEIHATQLASVSQGQPGRVLVSRDISDRVSQDERLIHQERLAVLGEVAAVMAHELNNPLAAISLYNQMLATELADQSGLLENVEVIQRNVDSCKQTIRELLDYATNTTPELDSVDVNATIEDGAQFLRLLGQRTGVQMTMKLSAEPLLAKIDEIQLRQVFVNLMVNAIQAVGTDGGEVSVETSQQDAYAIIDVRDNGRGIPADKREEIFRPFFTTKSRGEGTGLGLPTARRITEMHGGGLHLVSSSPAGTHFQVRLLLERVKVS